MIMDLSRSVQTAGRAVKLANIARALRKVSGKEGESRTNAQRALAALMADARGVPMKIGQFLASREGNEVFKALEKGIDPRPLEEMVASLEEHYETDPAAYFDSIEPSVAAASLGQVHRASLLDGTPVAVKIRYPDIAAAVEAEMRIAGLMPGLGPAKKWGFDLDAYKGMFASNMQRELDYKSEALRQKRFGETMKLDGLVVPYVYPDLCREGVLVQSWEDGLPIDMAAGWPVAERQRLARVLMATFFRSLFVTGLVHTDPNLGNVFARRGKGGEPEIVLLDYGCMIEIEERARLALLKVILGCHDDNDTDPLACFVEMGFDAEKLLPISETLPALCKILFEPLLQDEPFSPKYWDLGARIEGLQGELRWWFRSAGPADLFLIMRAFSGLVVQLSTLQVILPWRKVLLETVGQAHIAEAEAFEPHPVAESLVREARNFSSIAKFLRVSVMEGSRQIVRVTMPSTQVSRLEELIPEDVLERIRESNIDLNALSRKACEGGILPQELFALNVGARDYRVWLE